jgi:hypothetical protein
VDRDRLATAAQHESGVDTRARARDLLSH